MNFEAIQTHCMETYQSALVWIPEKTLIRTTYDADVRKVPKVCIGLPGFWGATELVMQNGTLVMSVAFSLDGSQVVSGLFDGTIQIWNTTTGVVETELKRHTGMVRSVAFSQDGSQVLSGSDDQTVRIWNVITGDVKAELKGHTDSVSSVAFSQDNSHIVSGSDDKQSESGMQQAR